MSEAEFKDNLGVPCYECPHCRRRTRWDEFRGRGSICAHPMLRHPVSGEAYQECNAARGMGLGLGARAMGGEYRICCGYFPDEHVARWRQETP